MRNEQSNYIKTVNDLKKTERSCLLTRLRVQLADDTVLRYVGAIADE